MSEAADGGYVILDGGDLDIIRQLPDQVLPQDGDSVSDTDPAGQADSPEIGPESTFVKSTQSRPECPCTEPFNNDVISLRCGCERCKPCFEVEVDIGLQRKTWPPQCREGRVEFTLQQIEQYLTPNQLQLWFNARDEHNDPDPRYCAAPSCARYPPSTLIVEAGKWLVCKTCKTRTCLGCNNLKAWHIDSQKCPEQIDAESLEEMRRKGCMPCPWCKSMIEREAGRDHMHCEFCGKNFCYSCGKKKGRAEMPCNCRGSNQWLEDGLNNLDVADHQDILDQVQNGLFLPDGINNVRGIELLGRGRFHGLDQRVGDDNAMRGERAVLGRIGGGYNHGRDLGLLTTA